ncbi:hypothetical protein NW739_01030 [Mycoplasmopsis felis]|uniref:hypothetical protein n=1 Tax=Mycoplasmopsis felis TaxID=33923 RepID=UPI0021B05FDB|nr:hypothetical protein [Mycoplasmopsis felis]MCU9933802.1 hypothetical protein [Mycoplasmopsis felis]MCU9939018.1 hypothetical protein [Mycoplasmopsis felis]MCU9939409.1 hypothetical protein [Mycoplasmopsis felis]UWV79188.1 hypothetical protein NW072_03805 [Mycoplasmopsis felis]WAM01461.1 hypothetical protein NWE60_02470 [Mycoplasmopsis felis]
MDLSTKISNKTFQYNQVYLSFDVNNFENIDELYLKTDEIENDGYKYNLNNIIRKPKLINIYKFVNDYLEKMLVPDDLI